MAEYLSKEDMNTGEYISRDDTLKAFHRYCENCDNCNGVMCRACDSADAMDIVIDMPKADVQPVKHGYWIPKGSDFWLCSNCENNLIYSTSDRDRTEKQRYCSRCGARMDGDSE